MSTRTSVPPAYVKAYAVYMQYLPSLAYAVFTKDDQTYQTMKKTSWLPKTKPFLSRVLLEDWYQADIEEFSNRSQNPI